MKKYLIYALVEVLLVMVGILLALQVNEWNNRRIDRKAELTYYENIKNQIERDKNGIKAEIEYNTYFMDQFIYANTILENRDRSMKDTLGRIAVNLKNYSDFDQQGNIYQTLVNSGQSKILSNPSILQLLQDLEERYMHINRMENIHYDAIMTYVIQETAWTVDFATGEILDEEKIYNMGFKNLVLSLISIMKEKDEVYHNTIRTIDQISEKIEEELAM